MPDIITDGVERDLGEMVGVQYGVSHVSSFCRSVNLRLFYSRETVVGNNGGSVSLRIVG
jgi:hypothetical protein